MSSKITIPSLSQFPCFVGLSHEEAVTLTRRLIPIESTPDQILFSQGDPGGAIYLVVSGEVEVRIRLHNGEERVVSVLGSGCFLGEISFLLGASRSATAACRTAAQLWMLEDHHLYEGISLGEAWAQQFLHVMAQGLARSLLAMDHELLALISKSEAEADPSGRVGELEQLRQKLFQEWAF
jgi:CRP-like cAMP-binding protein